MLKVSGIRCFRKLRFSEIMKEKVEKSEATNIMSREPRYEQYVQQVL